MRRTAKVLCTLCLLVLLGTVSGCKDPTAREMARQVADELVAYGEANGDYLWLVHSAVCNLDKSIWRPDVNPHPDDPTQTLIKAQDDFPEYQPLCPPIGPERGEPPDDPEDPFG